MDTNLSVAIIAASATMVTGISGMWINASQTGKRIDDLRADFLAFRVEVKTEIKELRTELGAFREMVNGKLQAIDFEIEKLMDRPK